MILWELLTRTKPYKGESFISTSVAVLKGIRPTIPPKTPSNYAKIMKKSWAINADARPSLDTILKYFKSEIGNDDAV